jgi:hypothetical protein
MIFAWRLLIETGFLAIAICKFGRVKIKNNREGTKDLGEETLKKR